MNGVDFKENLDNWHPILMVAGMIFCFLNAVVSFKILPFEKSTKKKVHAAFHIIGSLLIVLGLTAQFTYHKEQGYEHLFTSHSWLGLFTGVCYILQMILSVAVFQDFDPRINVPLRIRYKPLHVLIGCILLVSAGLTVAMGVTEKAFYGNLLYGSASEWFVVHGVTATVFISLVTTAMILSKK